MADIFIVFTKTPCYAGGFRKDKKTIREKGAEIEISNGSQHWTKERPAMNSYTKLIARYSTLFKQLCELMQGANTKNELIEFLKN